MQPEIIDGMARVQQRHWWFVARRRILRRVIRSLRPPPATLLEIGCGPGGNLAMMSGLGSVCAMETDPRALELARLANPDVDIRNGGLPDDVPFAGRRFDLVLLLDVLEHIEDESGALAGAGALLADGGRILVTVPAYQWLWGPHDRAHHHRRRYTARRLREAAGRAGLRAYRCGYFNTLLFPLVAAVRLAERWRDTGAFRGESMPPRIVNALLAAIFSAEALLAPRCLFPFGVSVIAVLGRG